MNLINKTSGKVLIENKEFNKDNLEIKEKIGYLPSEIYLYDDFTFFQEHLRRLSLEHLQEQS